ncbi:hypothetical protein EDB84DRAFT_1439054 [Lactarius hengduanensis]|nr:hypothetical protein EDB84DRAFT_1439054 [Lactarius hengduanensis]
MGPKTFHAAAALIISLLDGGASLDDGDLMASGLTPRSWMRLSLGILAAMIRGTLRSPSYMTKGTKFMNWHPHPDLFPINNALPRPLTEGGALMLMCQQLGGLYTSNHNHPDKKGSDITEGEVAQAKAEAQEAIRSAKQEIIRLDPARMQEIKDAVNAEIFANLNAEALQNIEEWRTLYQHDFAETMHTAFEAQYPGIHPDKGKAWAPPPISHSQVVRDAEPRIKAEVQALVNKHIKKIHQEVQDSLATGNPFWTGGPLRASIATTIRKATTEQVELELAEELKQIRQQQCSKMDAFLKQLNSDRDEATKEFSDNNQQKILATKKEFREELIKYVEDYKAGVRLDIKEWKVKYCTARDLSALRSEAHRFGYVLTLTDKGALQREASAFKKYALEPLIVDGYELSSSAPAVLRSLHSTPRPTHSPKHPPSSGNGRHPHACPHQTSEDRGKLDVPNSPLPSSSPPQPSSPMAQDAQDTDSNNGGLAASIHAPSCAPTPVVAAPSPLPARSCARLDVRTTNHEPSPAPLLTEPVRLEAPPPAPPMAASGDGLAALLTALQATIARLNSRLDAQDRRIEEIAKPRNPRNRNATGYPAKAKEAVAAPPEPNTAGPSAPLAMDETLSPPARVDDPAEEAITELFTPGITDPVPPVPQPTVTRESFQPPPSKVVPLTTDSRGKPTPATTLPATWAGIVTKSATGQQANSAALARAVTHGTGRTAGGKARPETVARRSKSGTTEITVIRRHGIDDPILEATLRKLTPAHIVGEARKETERLSANTLVMMGGRWSVNKTAHNFVYVFRDDIPFERIFPFRDALTTPLMAGHVVPNDGWTYAQMRGVPTSSVDGVVYNGSQIHTELARNKAFENVIFCVAPHWQGSMARISSEPYSTVAMAYIDQKGTVTAQATKDSVFMFNTRIKLVITAGAIASAMPQTLLHARSQPTASDASAVAALTTATTTPATAPTNTTRQDNATAISPALTVEGTTTPRWGSPPPPLAPAPPHGTTTAPPPPSAKGKAPAATPPSAIDLVLTQREQPIAPSGNTAAGDDDTTFQTVTRKRKGKNPAQRARARAARANSTIPGASNYDPSTVIPPSAGPPSARVTAKVPARPAYKGTTPEMPPTDHVPTSPPDWKDVPIIGPQHVATEEQTRIAFRDLCSTGEDAIEDLILLNTQWKGSEHQCFDIWYNPQKLAKIHDISTTVGMEAAWMWRRGWGRGDGYEAGVVTWRGLPCWGGGVLRATLGRRGGSAVTGSWRGGRRGGVLACRESADGGVLRSELSGVAGQGGVVRRRGAVWRVGGGKALRAVLGRHGDGLAVEVLRAVLRRRGGLAVARCWAETNGGGERARGGGNGLQRPGVAGWRWWRAASHVGAACSGGDKWRWRACTRGDNGLQRSG